MSFALFAFCLRRRTRPSRRALVAGALRSLLEQSKARDLAALLDGSEAYLTAEAMADRVLEVRFRRDLAALEALLARELRRDDPSLSVRLVVTVAEPAAGSSDLQIVPVRQGDVVRRRAECGRAWKCPGAGCASPSQTTLRGSALEHPARSADRDAEASQPFRVRPMAAKARDTHLAAR
jgi:hypothetical protein